MYSFTPQGGQPAWKSKFEGPIGVFGSAGHSNAPGNCEDPFLYFDRNGHFHVIGHCYTCYWWPSTGFTLHGKVRGDCSAKSAHCSGHGFSRTGAANNWTWVGGDDAPYNFTERNAAGGVTDFSTRERPWGLLGGAHGDQILALINGVSPPFPQLKFEPGRDWCYTNIQGVDAQ